MKKAPLIIFLSFIFTTVLVSNLSADNLHLFNANPEKNSNHSTSFTNSDLEENDPPVIIAPVGEITARSAQFYNFIWQPRHTAATLIRYELLIYEKVKGLSDNQIINATPPLFRTTTIANSYLYTPADPILKMNQDYLVMVQINSLKGDVSFKNNGKSRIETFKIIPSCIPGDTCDDGQDCTYDDRIVLDCECKGTPYYDPNNDGVCDELLLPAPEIYAPKLSEVKVGGKEFTTRWKKKHEFDLDIDYKVDVLRTGVTPTDTEVYQELSNKLNAEREAFLQQQQEEKVSFENKQNEALDDFNASLNTLNEECNSAFVQDQQTFEEQQTANDNAFHDSLNAILENCPEDQAAAKAIFESQLKKEQEDFAKAQTEELKSFNEQMTKALAKYEEQAESLLGSFKATQQEELDAFLAQLEIEKNETCGTQEAIEQTFESQKSELKEIRITCTEEADDYKSTVKKEAKEALKKVKEEIEIVELARELGETKHKELLSQLEADLKKNLKNATDKEQKKQIQIAHDKAVALAKENHDNILDKLNEKIAEFKNEQKGIKEKRAADLADAEATIKKLNRACRADYRKGLEALEANLTTSEQALESCLASLEENAITFANQQEEDLKQFSQEQNKNAQAFKEEQDQKKKGFQAKQNEALTLLKKSHEERRAAFVKDWPNCELLIAGQEGLYETQQIEMMPFMLNEIRDQIVDCLNKGVQLEEDFKQQKLEEKLLFEKEQTNELATFDDEQSRQKENLRSTVRAGGARQVVFTTHTSELSQSIISSDFKLEIGYKYAIQVTAKDLNGVARFENHGLSNEWRLEKENSEDFNNNTPDDKGEVDNENNNNRNECEVPIAICPTERAVTVCDYTVSLPFETNTKCDYRYMLVQVPGIGATWIHMTSPIGQQYFNWNYCANTASCTLTPLATFANDIQNWLDQEGHLGTVTYTNGSGTQSDQISISGTDVGFQGLYKNCTSTWIYEAFTQSNCQNETVYDLHPQGIEACQNPVYQWSTGETTPYISVPDLIGGDYNVTVTCAIGCLYYVSQEKLPCDDGDDCTINDGLDVNCNCIGIYADSDGDGVCDPNDACEGHDDNVDLDGNGVPDGCDGCAEEGQPCVHENPCIINEVYDENCDCIGMHVEVGLPCDDGDDCTTNDAYDANCDCVGQLIDANGDGICDECPLDDVKICSVETTVSLCDAYVFLYPESNPKCSHYQLVVEEPGVGTYTYIDNSSSIGQAFFNWNYCAVTNTCSSYTPLQVLANDISAWLNHFGYYGTVSYQENVGSGNATRIMISQTNVEFIKLQKQCLGDPNTEHTFNRSSCHDITAYYLEPSFIGECNNPTYEWSTGATTDHIIVQDIAPEYTVTVTCDDGCSYSGSSNRNPENCEVGAPCDDLDPCTSNDQINSCCDCVGIYAGDTDGDGVCDPLDLCEGHPDHIDTDNNGIPDGCGPIPICVDRSGNDLDYCGAIKAIAKCLRDDGIDNDEQFLDTRGISQVFYDFLTSDPNIILEGDVTITGNLGNLNVSNDGDDPFGTTFDIGLVVGDNGMADGDGDGVCDLLDICHSSTQGDWVDDFDEDGNSGPDGLPDECGCNFSNPYADVNFALGMYIKFKFDRTCELTFPNPANPDLFCTIYGEYDCACDCISNEEYDSDGDTVCDEHDLCHGGDDLVDLNNNGIPDACDAEDPCPMPQPGDLEQIEDLCPSSEAPEDMVCVLYAYLQYDDEIGDCKCVYVADGDDDGDTICNLVDACEGHDDRIDDDGDQISDGCDMCINTEYPGSIGDPCDDGEVCTINDMLDYIYNEELLSVILDEATYPGVFQGIDDPLDVPGLVAYLRGDDLLIGDLTTPEVERVPAQIWANLDNTYEDQDGNFFALMIIGCDCIGFEFDSDYDDVCDENDVCPGFDDNLDYDNDGIPDGCDPPYYEIGCQNNISFLLEENYTGLILTWNNSDIVAEQIPNPISLMFLKSSMADVFTFDHVPLSNFQNLADENKTIALYELPYIDPADVPYYAPNYHYTGEIQYSTGQFCYTVEILNNFDCQGDNYYSLDGYLAIGQDYANYAFINRNSIPSYVSEINLSFAGINPLVTGGSITGDVLIDGTGTGNNEGVFLIKTDIPVEGQSTGLVPLGSATGSITYDDDDDPINGSDFICTYDNGAPQSNCVAYQQNGQEIEVYIGEPCWDGSHLTVEDRYEYDPLLGHCVCTGQMHDQDGDGVHDTEDICPGGDDNIDSDGDGIPDFCECEVPVVATQDFGDGVPVPMILVQNGNDVQITLVENELHGSYSATWTPELPAPPNDVDQPVVSNSNILNINGFATGETYIISITATCLLGENAISDPLEVEVTIPGDDFNCLEANIPDHPEPCEVVTNLYVGDVVNVGDFNVTISEITSNDGEGGYTGSGYVSVPYFNFIQIQLTFEEGVEVKECSDGLYYVTHGYMEVPRDGNLEDIFDDFIGDFNPFDGNLLDDIGTALTVLQQLANDIDNIEDYNENVHDLASDISSLLPGVPFMDQGLIDGLNGAINCMATVPTPSTFEQCQTELNTAIENLVNHQENLYKADDQVLFYGAAEQKYGFDKMDYQIHQANYDQIEAIAEEAYPVAWKSVVTGQSDVVNAMKDDETGIPNITFTDNLNSPLIFTDITGGHKQITVQGLGQHGNVQEVYAVQSIAANNPDHTEHNALAHPHIAGKLNVVSYDAKELKIALVNVNNEVTVPTTIQQDLDKIFQQAGVLVNTKIISDYSIPSNSNLLPNPFPDTESGLTSAYPGEMNDIIADFKDTRFLDDDTYYVFLLNVPHEVEKKTGFMPKKRDFGFIFCGTNNGINGMPEIMTKTIAHELAHGAYHLEHTFETHPENPELTGGQFTENLMDYGTGTLLRKYQWDLIHNPEGNFTLFDSDDESDANASGPWKITCMPELGPINSVTHFSDLSNKAIRLDNGSSGNNYRPWAFISNQDNNGVAHGAVAIIINTETNVKYYPNNGTRAHGKYFPRKSNGKLDLTTFISRDGSSDGGSNGGIIPLSGNSAKKVFTKRVTSGGYYDIVDIGIVSHNPTVSYTFQSCFEPEFVEDSSNGQVFLSNLTEEQKKALDEFLSGAREFTDDDGQSWNNIEARLYVTDNTTPTALLNDLEGWTSTTNKNTAGEYVIWLSWDESTGKYLLQNTSLANQFPTGEDITYEGSTKKASEHFMDKVKSYFSTVQDKLGDEFTGIQGFMLYVTFDLLDKGLEQLKIKPHVWDCGDPNYDKRYSKAFGYLKLVLNPLGEMTTNHLLEELSNAPNIDPKIQGIIQYYAGNREKLEFALICGMWNGAVDILTSVPKLIKALAAPVNAYNEFTKILDKMREVEYVDEDDPTQNCKDGLWCGIWVKVWHEQLDPGQEGNRCRFANTLGTVAFSFVAAALSGGSGGSGAAANLVGRVAKVFVTIENLTDPGNLLTVLKPITRKAGGAIKSFIGIKKPDGNYAKLIETKTGGNGDPEYIVLKEDGSTITLQQTNPVDGVGESLIDGRKVVAIEQPGQPTRYALEKDGNANDRIYIKTLLGKFDDILKLTFNAVDEKIVKWFGDVRIKNSEPGGAGNNLVEASGSGQNYSITYDGQEVMKVIPDPSVSGGSKLDRTGTYMDADGAMDVPPGELVEVMPDGSNAIRNKSDNTKKFSSCATCLAEGTPVYLNDETQTIESLREGQPIQGYDEKNNSKVTEKVVSVINRTTEKIKRIYTGAKYLAATGTHRIYLPQMNKYLPVDSLKTGMKLLSLTGALLAIDSITTVHATTPIYDIEVTGVHNYYAGEAGVLVHNNSVCDVNVQKILGGGSNPLSEFAKLRLAAVLRNTDNLNLSQYLDFINDLNGSVELRDFIRQVDVDFPPPLTEVQKNLMGEALLGKVGAWKFLLETRNGQLRKAGAVLEVVSRQLNNGVFINAIGLGKYKSILKKYAGPFSGVPPNSGNANLRSVDEMLDNLENFVTQYNGLPSAQNPINLLNSATSNGQAVIKNQYASSFIMDVLKKEGVQAQSIKSFEAKFENLELPEYNFIADMEMLVFDVNIIEFKSWSTSSIDLVSSLPIQSQFLGYFKKRPANLNNIPVPPNEKSFQMWFDKKRLGVMSEDYIKQKYVDMLKVGDNANQLFYSNPNYFLNRGINNGAALKNIANTDPNFFQSPIFDFVKIK